MKVTIEPDMPGEHFEPTTFELMATLALVGQKQVNGWWGTQRFLAVSYNGRFGLAGDLEGLKLEVLAAKDPDADEGKKPEEPIIQLPGVRFNGANNKPPRDLG